MTIDFTNLNIKKISIGKISTVQSSEMTSVLRNLFFDIKVNTLIIKNLNRDNFDTPVTDISKLFYNCGCENIKFIDCCFEDATIANHTFCNSKNLKSIKVEYTPEYKYNSDNGLMPSIITCDRMFSGCTSIINLDLTKIMTCKKKAVVNIANMFRFCTSLKELDLSSLVMERLDVMIRICEYKTMMMELGIGVSYIPADLIHLCDKHILNSHMLFNKTVEEQIKYIQEMNELDLNDVKVIKPKNNLTRELLFGKHHSFDIDLKDLNLDDLKV